MRERILEEESLDTSLWSTATRMSPGSMQPLLSAGPPGTRLITRCGKSSWMRIPTPATSCWGGARESSELAPPLRCGSCVGLRGSTGTGMLMRRSRLVACSFLESLTGAKRSLDIGRNSSLPLRVRLFQRAKAPRGDRKRIEWIESSSHCDSERTSSLSVLRSSGEMMGTSFHMTRSARMRGEFPVELGDWEVEADRMEMSIPVEICFFRLISLSHCCAMVLADSLRSRWRTDLTRHSLRTRLRSQRSRSLPLKQTLSAVS
mmetsp:Transcript_24999/g.56398  ORF Transcript_24999/g.56398 Transcript_24999/m.56398 type:complete len:261 (-) Transcript_24999:1327-2109(-)